MSPTFVPRRSATWSSRVRWSRHAVQAVVLGFIVWRMVLKALDESTAASPEAFCPFGGFETAWTWLTTGRTVSHVHSSNLVLAGIVVVLAVVARGFFCGWLCALGTVQEAVRGAAAAVVRRVPALRRAGRRVQAATPWWPRLDAQLRYLRYAVLVWAVVGAAVTGTMVFREYDPWAAFLAVAEFEFSTAFVALLAVLILSLFVDRPFCRYACPLGAVQGLIGKASPVALQRDAATCMGCDICNEACPMGLPVNQHTRVTDAECIGCLECAAACPSRDALGVTFTLPSRARVGQQIPITVSQKG